jgi:hypothetical protein
MEAHVGYVPGEKMLPGQIGGGTAAQNIVSHRILLSKAL